MHPCLDTLLPPLLSPSQERKQLIGVKDQFHRSGSLQRAPLLPLKRQHWLVGLPKVPSASLARASAAGLVSPHRADLCCESGLGLIFKIAVRNSEYLSSCCHDTCTAGGEGAWLGAWGCWTSTGPRKSGVLYRQEGRGTTAASGILGPSCCCFPVVQVHQGVVKSPPGQAQVKGKGTSWCFPAGRGKPGSWGCLWHPFRTSPRSPPFPLLAEGLIHQAEFLMQSLGREPAHHRALV